MIDKSASNGTRVIITGGSGFIGTNLVSLLIARGYTVLNLDIRPPRNRGHNEYWWKCDLENPMDLLLALSRFRPDFIVHCAARTDLYGQTIQDYTVNTDGVSNLIDSCNQIGSVKRIIFLSSMLVCRLGYRPKDWVDVCPDSMYGESKAIGEELVRESESIFEWVILRPTSIWGPWFDVPYKSFFSTVQAGLYVQPKNKEVLRSYGYVGNTVAQIESVLTAAGSDVDRKISYLCDYQPTELLEWANMISGEFGKRPIREVPLSIMMALAKIGDGVSRLLDKEAPLTTRRLTNMVTDAVFHPVTLQQLLPMLPYTTLEGVKTTVTWMLSDDRI